MSRLQGGANGQVHILVTGGAGFVGSHVVQRALEEGYEVTVLDNLYTGSLSNLNFAKGNPKLHFVHHNVQHPFPLDVFNQTPSFSHVFHLACPASPVHYQSDPIGTTMTAVNGTLHALNLATKHDCPILIASTSEVYGDPDVHPQTESYWGNVNCTGIRSCYDEGKRCAEALCFDFNRRYNTKVRVIRIFNTYGPRMVKNDGRVVSNFIVQALENKPITIYGDGSYTRSFQYVSDLVEGMWRAISHPNEIGPTNMGNPRELTVKQLAEAVLRFLPESTSQIEYHPPASDDPRKRKPDISKAQKQFNGWTPVVALEEGLQLTIEDFKSRCSCNDE